MICNNCKGTGKRQPFSEYLDCMEPGCNAAVERAEFNKRLKEAGSMSVEDAAWWGRMDIQARGNPAAWMVGMDVFKTRDEAYENIRNPDLVPVPLYR